MTPPTPAFAAAVARLAAACAAAAAFAAACAAFAAFCAEASVERFAAAWSVAEGRGFGAGWLRSEFPLPSGSGGASLAQARIDEPNNVHSAAAIRG
jgi:hypothetical protein